MATTVLGSNTNVALDATKWFGALQHYGFKRGTIFLGTITMAGYEAWIRTY